MHTINVVFVILSLWFAYVAWVFYKSIDGQVRFNLMCTFGSLSWSFAFGAFLVETKEHIQCLNDPTTEAIFYAIALAPLLTSMCKLVVYVKNKYPGSFLT